MRTIQYVLTQEEFLVTRPNQLMLFTGIVRQTYKIERRYLNNVQHVMNSIFSLSAVLFTWKTAAVKINMEITKVS